MTSAMYDAAQTVLRFRNIVGAIRMYGATQTQGRTQSSPPVFLTIIKTAAIALSY